MDDFKDSDPLDEDAELFLQQERAKERAARSDAQWWEEDYLSSSKADQLKRAIEDLREGCGCEVGRLLSDLREIEGLSAGYVFFLGRRELPQIINTAQALANALQRIEMSPLADSVPKDLIASERLSQLADGLEKAREATRRTPRPERAKRISQLLAYVDGQVRERGQVGKGPADAALAVLLGAVTCEKWTRGAMRMARSRVNKRRGRKRVPKDRPRAVYQRLRGSRAKDRKSRLVPLNEYLAAENSEDDGD